MERKTEKNKNILIGVLVAVIVILAGLCIYLLFVKKDSEVVAESNNSFDKYKTNLVNNIKNGKSDVFKSEIFEYNGGHYIVALTKELNLVLRKNNAYVGDKAGNIDYTIKSNVIDFFLVPWRLSGLEEIYYINNDGTLERFSPISYIAEKKVDVEKNSTYRNIISIIRGSGCPNCRGETDIEPYFIDINGNVYNNVYSYWK